jgi:GntR family transcriptional regulator
MADVTYRKVYNVLREKIIDKTLPAGEKVPPERVLCDTFGVSRITVRHALQMLQDQGLVERFPGKGTFVRPMREKKMPILDMDYEKYVKNEAPDIERKLLTNEVIAPPEHIMRLLGLLKSEECLLIERLDVINSDPLSYDMGYIPLNFTASIDEDMLCKVEFLRLWEKSEGLTISYVQSATEAIGADAVAAKRLQIPMNTPILLTTDLVYSPEGKPLAVFITAYRGDRYTLVSTNYSNPQRYTNGYTL